MIIFLLGVILGFLIATFYVTYRMKKKLVPITSDKIFLVMPSIQKLLDLEKTTNNSERKQLEKIKALTKPVFYVMFSE